MRNISHLENNITLILVDFTHYTMIEYINGGRCVVQGMQVWDLEFVGDGLGN